MFGAKKKNKKVFVGLSGGVDSAVSAALLQKQGYEVTGVFIRIALPGYPCSAGEDKISAMRVAAHLGLPFLEVDLSREYKEEVFRAAVGDFARGKTPNPDTLCNQKIKFGHFWEFARARGADFIATGHYAQTKDGELFAGADPEKDQSYFLWMVPQEVLARTLFPVGGFTKKEVRTLAKKFKLPNAARPDSQGLCFLGDVTIEDMLRKEIKPVPGHVLNEAGDVVGVHQGAALYTLGERRGFTLESRSPSTAPQFVIAKDIAANTITVSPRRTPAGATKTELVLADVNWIGPCESGRYVARFRYRGILIGATLEKEKNIIVLDEACYVPEGQSLVVYDGARCVGGGSVDRAILH
jgi:tRNA-specific 2-thiouridylase